MRISSVEPDIARIAAAIGEPTRAAMLSALLSGRWLTAGELARTAGVAPATATEHLARLLSTGLVLRRNEGRHRYFALAGASVGEALEALARIRPGVGDAAKTRPPAGRGGEAARTPPPALATSLRFARTCYDHLAGTLGVAVTDAMVEREYLARPGLQVTTSGEAWLRALDIETDVLRRDRRPLCRPCLDWSERRDHLAGAIGAALTALLLDRRWLDRIDGTRAVRLTARGRDGLYRSLGMEGV